MYQKAINNFHQKKVSNDQDNDNELDIPKKKEDNDMEEEKYVSENNKQEKINDLDS